MVEQRVRDIAWAISQNPVTVTIERKERALTDGHFAETVREVGSYTVRIFLNRRSKPSPSETSDIGGRTVQTTSFSMLCDASVDVKKEPNITDYVNVPLLGKMEVDNVTPLIVNGQVVGYQVDLVGVEK